VITVPAANFGRLWEVPAESWALPLFVARLVFLATIMGLIARWVYATLCELMIWKTWMCEPVAKRDAYAAVLVLAPVLGVLFGTVYNVTFCSGFVSTALLVNYWTQWVANYHFAETLQKTRKSHLDTVQLRALRALETYWVRRPQLGRLATMMYFSSLAFALALAGFVQPEPARSRLQTAAYAVLILTIIIGETVVTVWRYRRNKSLAPVERYRQAHAAHV
jgi:hypothetical protein